MTHSKKIKYYNTFKKAYVHIILGIIKKKYLGTWRLILEAGQIQVYRSHSNIPSCMSKCRFSMIRISILTSKQYMTTWRLLVSDPGGWSAPSRVSDIIFDVKIEIIIIENLHLDIYEGILEVDLYTCIWPASRISLLVAKYFFLYFLE